MSLSKINKHKYLLIFIVLVVISILDFTFYIKKELFFRFKYELKNSEIIQDFGEVEIVKADHKTIILKDTTLHLLPKKYYSIQFENGKTFNFTFDNIIKEETLQLNYVVWLFVKPLKNYGNAYLKEISIPRDEKGKTKITFISDNLGCCLMNGKKMRYEWNKINSNLKFEGDKKDVFGYRYRGAVDFSTRDFIPESQSVKNQDVIVVWIGRTERNIPPEKSVENLELGFKNLRRNNPKAKIVLLFPAPSPEEGFEKKISGLVKLLGKEDFGSDIQIVDLYSFIKSQNNWEEIFFFEKYGLTERAYQKIVKHLNREILK